MPKSPSASVDRKRRSRPTSNAHRRKGAGGQVKARDVGMCRGGAYTQPRNGKGDAYRHWKRHRPGAIARRWTEQVVLDAMRDWQTLYGRLPSSYDWSRTHARRRGGQRFGGWRAGSGRHPPSSPRCSGLGESCVKRPRRLRRTDSVIALDSSLNRCLSHDRRIPGNRGSGSSTRSDRTTVASCSRRGTGRRVQSTTFIRTSSHVQPGRGAHGRCASTPVGRPSRSRRRGGHPRAAPRFHDPPEGSARPDCSTAGAAACLQRTNRRPKSRRFFRSRE